jgi:hypothetical protein
MEDNCLSFVQSVKSGFTFSHPVSDPGGDSNLWQFFQPFSFTELFRMENNSEWHMHSVKLKLNPLKHNPNIRNSLHRLDIDIESIDKA